MASVERLRTDMEGLLAALSGDAECRLGNIGLPSARVPLADGACPDRYPLVHQRIGEVEPAHAGRHRGALVFDERSHSFAELDARASRLAHALVERGVAADVRVGVALPRGTELVVALLAVLKAGGAYVPLDLAYPRERLAYLMRDSASLAAERKPGAGAVPVPAGVPPWPWTAWICWSIRRRRRRSRSIPPTSPTSSILRLHRPARGVAVSHGPLAMHIDAVGEALRDVPGRSRAALHVVRFRRRP
ncbi:AMP-binding protein [Pseudomonas aeruginosa]|nr:AMP-binding protein [Pseudomonas aeruginosa]